MPSKDCLWAIEREYQASPELSRHLIAVLSELLGAERSDTSVPAPEVNRDTRNEATDKKKLP